MDLGLVCDHCDWLNDTEAEACASCGLMLQPADTTAEDAPAPPQRSTADTAAALPALSSCATQPSAVATCPHCEADVLPQMRFCGACGQRLSPEGLAAGTGPTPPPSAGTAAARTLFFGAMQVPNRAKLVLIKGEGIDGVSYHLQATEHTVGREHGDIRFPEDGFLSPQHACFYYDQGRLLVRDEHSTNGVFLRIPGEAPLYPGADFLLGEQLLRFELVTDLNPQRPPVDSEGTYYYSSPQRPGSFKLVQILRGGQIGMIFRAPTSDVTLGREGNDINFPDDPFISGQHAMVRMNETTCALIDLGSKNGTYIRMTEPHVLNHGDYIFLGQQLLRLEIS